MTTSASYSGLNIDSSELISIKINRSLQVNSQETLALYELTQAGVLKALRFSISANIRNDADNKLVNWLNKFASKPLDNLIILGKNWGDYHFENIDIDVEDFENTNTIIAFKMNLNFTQYINFT